MTARWEETLDHQLDLLKALNSRDGRAFVEGWVASVRGEGPSGKATGWQKRNGEPVTDIPDHVKRYADAVLGDLPDRLSAMVFNSDPVYVDPDIWSVVEAASEGFEPEPLRATDLITDAGFMWLPRPVRERDIHDKEMSWRAVMWYPMTAKYTRDDGSLDSYPGVFLSLFHYVPDKDDYTFTPKEMASVRGAGQLLLTHAAPWEFDRGYERLQTGLFGVAKIVQCAWRLMMQTLAVRSQERASKPFRRRWEREDLPEKRVTVVRLRRPETPRDPDAEHHSVEWTHRWLVGGHWRNQWYPSLGIHRQVWISPYVKGPDDKPLEVRKTRVFEFVR